MAKSEDIIVKKETEMISLDNIKMYKKNPKEHPDEQIEKIKMSIRENGFSVPMLIDGNNQIIAGHGRYLAAKELNMEEVPVIKRDDLTEKQIKLFRIADNKVSQSGWNDELLANEFDELIRMDNITEEELQKTGFDEVEIEELYAKFDYDELEFNNLDEKENKSEGKNSNDTIICPECGSEINL